MCRCIHTKLHATSLFLSLSLAVHLADSFMPVNHLSGGLKIQGRKWTKQGVRRMESSGNVHFIGPEWYYSKDKSTQKLTHQSRQLVLRSATIAALMLIQQKATEAPLNCQNDVRSGAGQLAWTALGLQDTMTQTTAEYRSASLIAW